MPPPPLGGEDGLTAFLGGHPEARAALAAVAALGLPDAWIGAGFLRNAVWDALHGRAPRFGGEGDVDVLFFDPGAGGPEREQASEGLLAQAAPGLRWSVRNQARMHARNGDRPYRGTEDAMRFWPETATAVAARLRPDGAVALLAPFGLGDLLGLVVRPTPAALARPGKLAAHRARVREKRWAERWPRLTFPGAG